MQLRIVKLKWKNLRNNGLRLKVNLEELRDSQFEDPFEATIGAFPAIFFCLGDLTCCTILGSAQVKYEIALKEVNISLTRNSRIARADKTEP